MEGDFVQEFDIGFLPRIWAQADPYCALCQTKKLSFNTEPTEQRSWQLDLPSSVMDDRQASYLILEISSRQDTNLQLHYGKSSLTINIKASATPLRYILRPSILRTWWSDSSAVVTLSSVHPVMVASAELLEAD